MVDFFVPTVYWEKLKEIEKEDKYLDLARELKTMGHESDGDTNCNCFVWYSHQRNDKETGELENKRTSEDHPKDSLIKISKNTEKSPGDWRKFAGTHTPVEDHQLLPVGKKLSKE